MRGLWLRLLRDAVGAARSRVIRTIGYEFFAFGKLDLLLRPEHVVVNAIGNVCRLGRLQADDARLSEIKIGIMSFHDRIPGNGMLQFLSAIHASLDNRVGIDRTAIQIGVRPEARRTCEVRYGDLETSGSPVVAWLNGL